MGETPRRLALAQGAYWGATGVWPILHLPSFEAVTGRKKEHWLVKTTGALIAAVGGTLLYAGSRGKVTPSVMFLGASSAIALGAFGGWYAARGRIRRVYLADAAVEAILAAAWARVAREEDRRSAAGTRLPIDPAEAVPEP